MDTPKSLGRLSACPIGWSPSLGGIYEQFVLRTVCFMFSFDEYAWLCHLELPYVVCGDTMMLCYHILLLFVVLSRVIMMFNPLLDTIT